RLNPLSLQPVGFQARIGTAWRSSASSLAPLPNRPAHALPQRLQVGIVNGSTFDGVFVDDRFLGPLLTLIQPAELGAIAGEVVRDRPWEICPPPAAVGRTPLGCASIRAKQTSGESTLQAGSDRA